MKQRHLRTEFLPHSQHHQDTRILLIYVYANDHYW